MDSNELELIKQAMIDSVDRVYIDEYAHLFPDIEPPVQELDELNVGDSIFDSDGFINLVLNTYIGEAELVGGMSYKPPALYSISESMKVVYEDEIDHFKDEGLIEEDDEDGLLCLLTACDTIDDRIIEVLNSLELCFLDSEMAFRCTDPSASRYNRVFNTSTINLFELDYKNVYIDRGSKQYVEEIQRGYSNMLRMCVENL